MIFFRVKIHAIIQLFFQKEQTYCVLKADIIGNDTVSFWGILSERIKSVSQEMSLLIA